MKHIKTTIILLMLACIVFAVATVLLSGMADGRADFAKWANRSARVLEPANYNVNGTCSCAVCCWKGVQGIGNMGIGDGNISLMKPEVLGDLVKSSMTAAGTASETVGAGNVTAGNETVANGNSTDVVIRALDSNQSGNGALVSQNPEPQPAKPEAEDEAPVTESLYPDYDLAASVIPRYAPYSITINKPFEHILAEDPCEAAALYGKLIGFTMPSGQVIDVGIKSIGYEY